MEVRKPYEQEIMFDLYAKAEQIVPLAEKDGEVWVTFEDAAVLNSINAQEPKTGMQTRNHDGTLASTGKRVHAVNPDYFFANKCMTKGTGKSKKLYVVSGHESEGYRCIKEQQTGHLFISHVPVYVFSRDEEGQLICEGLSSVPAETFIKDYTDRLSNDVMASILPMISSFTTRQNLVTELPI